MSEEGNDEVRGIGGWLIILGIGVVWAPIAILIILGSEFPFILESVYWDRLTKPGSGFYHPDNAVILVWGMVQNLILLVVSLYFVFLFFTRSKKFPLYFIYFNIFIVVLVVFQDLILSVIAADTPMFQESFMKDLAKSIIKAAIWIPYMLRSKRVKATFVK